MLAAIALSLSALSLVVSAAALHVALAAQDDVERTTDLAVEAAHAAVAQPGPGP